MFLLLSSPPTLTTALNNEMLQLLLSRLRGNNFMFPHPPLPTDMADHAEGPHCAHADYLICKHAGGESYETTAHGIRTYLINTLKEQLKSYSTSKMHN